MRYVGCTTRVSRKRRGEPMPIEMSYAIKCDICPNVMIEGPWDIAMDHVSLATLPRVQLGDWVIVDYKVVCPKHKIKIFKGRAHGKKKKDKPGFIMTMACRDNLHAECSSPRCRCPHHNPEEKLG